MVLFFFGLCLFNFHSLWNFENRNGLTNNFLNVGQVVFFRLIYETNGNACFECATCSSDAVNIVFVMAGDLKIYYVRNFKHIYASSGNVGAHENANVTVFEILNRVHARVLSNVAVKESDFTHIASRHEFSHGGRVCFGSHKNHYTLHLISL